MQKILFYLLLVILFASCGTSKKTEELHNYVSFSQHCYNDSIKTNYAEGKAESKRYLEYSRLEKIHKKRLALFKKENIDITVKNGYVYFLEATDCCYSGISHMGNIWSNDFNYYYSGDRISNFELEDSSSPNISLLLKRAIEEWDLNQIKKYYSYVDTVEGGQIIAARVKIINGKIITIDCFQWHDSEY